MTILEKKRNKIKVAKIVGTLVYRKVETNNLYPKATSNGKLSVFMVYAVSLFITFIDAFVLIFCCIILWDETVTTNESKPLNLKRHKDTIQSDKDM